jgi:hypothetical protein
MWRLCLQSLLEQLKQGCSSMAAFLPLASTSLSHTSTEAEIYYGLAKAVDVSIFTSVWFECHGLWHDLEVH